MHHGYCAWLVFILGYKQFIPELPVYFMCSEKAQTSQKLEPQVYVGLFAR